MASISVTSRSAFAPNFLTCLSAPRSLPRMRTECPRIPSPGVVVRSFENEPKARINIRAGAWNVDCVGVSQKTPAGAFRKLAVRVEVICCYASSIPNQHATRWRRLYLAVVRSGYFRRLGHFFSSPESCFARQRVCDSSARGSRVEASVNGYRTVLRPSQTVRSTSNANDNRMHW